MGNYDNTKAKAAQAAAQNKMQQLADMVIACGSARSGLLPRSLAPLPPGLLAPKPPGILAPWFPGRLHPRFTLRE